MAEKPSTSNSSSLVTRLQGIWRPISVPVMAVVISLLLGALLLLISGTNPLVAYGGLLEGAFGDARALRTTLENATPLIFSGLAVAFAFKAGLFNIGAQGQLVFGSLAAAIVGFGVTGLPAVIHIPLALLAGAIAGALYGAIPGALRTYTGAHEVITTIMLNYIALNITDYLANGPLKDPSPSNVIARTPKILDSAVIPDIPFLGWLPIGFILAVIMAAITWWLLWRTTLGYEIRTVGQNPNAARYAGMRVSQTIILTMVISGMMAGIGGAVETLGIVGRFQPGFNVGLGFDGITIALLAKTNPYGVIPAAILVGAMDAGSSMMQFRSDVATEIIDLIQAAILFFVAAEMIVRWIIRQRGESDGGISLTSGWGSNS